MSDQRERAEDQLLAQALRRAYGEGSPCPDPVLFLEEDTLDEAERQRLAAHVSTCPACAAERELALGFAAPVEEPADAGEIESLLAQLREQRNRQAPSTQARPAAARARRRWFAPRSLSAPLALAASVLLAAVVVIGGLREPTAPELPTFEPGTTMRGARVEALAPEGLLSKVPEAFHWRGVEGAASYRVTLLAVDDSVLWSGTSPASPLRLPASLSERLYPAVRYRWQVEADGPTGPMAASELVDFRIDPRFDED